MGKRKPQLGHAPSFVTDTLFMELENKHVSNALCGDQNVGGVFSPNTQWEMLKWNREDRVGFWLAMGMVIGIIAMLYFMVNLGGSIFGG